MIARFDSSRRPACEKVFAERKAARRRLRSQPSLLLQPQNGRKNRRQGCNKHIDLADPLVNLPFFLVTLGKTGPNAEVRQSPIDIRTLQELDRLEDEADQLVAITVASKKTARGDHGPKSE